MAANVFKLLKSTDAFKLYYENVKGIEKWYIDKTVVTDLYAPELELIKIDSFFNNHCDFREYEEDGRWGYETFVHADRIFGWANLRWSGWDTTRMPI